MPAKVDVTKIEKYSGEANQVKWKIWKATMEKHFRLDYQAHNLPDDATKIDLAEVALEGLAAEWAMSTQLDDPRHAQNNNYNAANAFTWNTDGCTSLCLLHPYCHRCRLERMEVH